MMQIFPDKTNTVFPALGEKPFPAILFAACSLFLLLNAYPSTLQAHPPKDVSLSYDALKQVLSVTISHSSSFPNHHYIKIVDISVGGKTVKNTAYTSQPAEDTFTYTYPIVLSPGDQVSAKAACNIFGALERKIVIQKPQ